MTVYRRPDPIPRARHHVAAPDAVLTPVRAEADELSNLVGRQIFGAILSGRFPEGSVLPNEISLAEQLGVSRTALREAIKGLAAKGLLASRRRRGTLVLDRRRWNMLDADIISWFRLFGSRTISRELWDAFVAVLPALAEAAARDRHGEGLTRHAAEMAKLPDGRDLLSTRLGFVDQLAVACHNRFLANLARAAVTNLFREDPEFLAGALARVDAAFAASLADAIAQGDVSRARRIVMASTEPTGAFA